MQFTSGENLTSLSPGKEKVMSTFKTATKSHGDLNTKCNALDKAIQNVLKSILKYMTWPTICLFLQISTEITSNNKITLRRRPCSLGLWPFEPQTVLLQPFCPTTCDILTPPLTYCYVGNYCSNNKAQVDPSSKDKLIPSDTSIDIYVKHQIQSPALFQQGQAPPY